KAAYGDDDHALWQAILGEVGERLKPVSQTGDFGRQLRMLRREREMVGKKGADFADVHSPDFVRIPSKRLTRFGRVGDPETPLGFYAALSPFPQSDPENFIVYAPCLTGCVERFRYGPELVTYYALSTY